MIDFVLTCIVFICRTGNLSQHSEMPVLCCTDHKTALQFASSSGNLEVCRLLINFGADVNMRDEGALDFFSNLSSEFIMAMWSF